MAVILIADEPTAAREALTVALTALGHEVVSADDGNLAMDLINKQAPDLVVLEVVLAGLNGFQLCRLIRGQDATRRVPILITTTLDRDADRYWGLKQGADEYLIKPIDAVSLAQKVHGFVAPAAAAAAP